MTKNICGFPTRTVQRHSYWSLFAIQNVTPWITMINNVTSWRGSDTPTTPTTTTTTIPTRWNGRGQQEWQRRKNDTASLPKEIRGKKWRLTTKFGHVTQCRSHECAHKHKLTQSISWLWIGLGKMPFESTHMDGFSCFANPQCGTKIWALTWQKFSIVCWQACQWFQLQWNCAKKCIASMTSKLSDHLLRTQKDEIVMQQQLTQKTQCLKHTQCVSHWLWCNWSSCNFGNSVGKSLWLTNVLLSNNTDFPVIANPFSKTCPAWWAFWDGSAKHALSCCCLGVWICGVSPLWWIWSRILWVAILCLSPLAKQEKPSKKWQRRFSLGQCCCRFWCCLQYGVVVVVVVVVVVKRLGLWLPFPWQQQQ